MQKRTLTYLVHTYVPERNNPALRCVVFFNYNLGTIMKILIVLLCVFVVSGCSSSVHIEGNPYLVAGGVVAANVILAQVEERYEGNKQHTGHSFVMGAMFTNIPGISKDEANIACALVGTTRELYKHVAKDVQFSVRDATFNVLSCALGVNFRIGDNHGTPTLNYDVVFAK